MMLKCQTITNELKQVNTTGVIGVYAPNALDGSFVS